MPLAFPPRRRAARFAELVDQPAPLRHTEQDDQELVDLADTADELRFAGATASPASATFRTELRAMLVAAAQRQRDGTEPADAVPERSRAALRHRIRVGAAAGLAVGLASVVVLTTVSADAVPGDTLYSLKRSAENAQLAVAASDIYRGSLYLDFARERMREADAVAGDAAEIQQILDDMDAQTTQGVKILTTAAVTWHDQEALARVDAFVKAQKADMPRMMADLAGAAHGRAIDSNNLLDGVRIRVTWLQTDLACTNISSAKVDGLGPIPRSCATRSGQTPMQTPTASASPTPLTVYTRSGHPTGLTVQPTMAPTDAPAPVYVAASPSSTPTPDVGDTAPASPSPAGVAPPPDQLTTDPQPSSVPVGAQPANDMAGPSPSGGV